MSINVKRLSMVNELKNIQIHIHSICIICTKQSLVAQKNEHYTFEWIKKKNTQMGWTTPKNTNKML